MTRYFLCPGAPVITIPPADNHACAVTGRSGVFTPSATVAGMFRQRSIPAPATAFAAQLLFHGVRAAASVKARPARRTKAPVCRSQKGYSRTVLSPASRVSRFAVQRKGIATRAKRAKASQKNASTSKRRSAPLCPRSLKKPGFCNLRILWIRYLLNFQ
jgi:hypothetical protein